MSAGGKKIKLFYMLKTTIENKIARNSFAAGDFLSL